MKKYIGLAAILCCIVSLTGCGKSISITVSTTDNVSEVASTASSAENTMSSTAVTATASTGNSPSVAGTVYNETTLAEAMDAEAASGTGTVSLSDPYDYEGGCRAFDVNTTYVNGLKSIATVIYSNDAPDSMIMTIVLPDNCSYGGDTFGDYTKVDEHTLRSGRNTDAAGQMASFGTFDECYKFYSDMCEAFYQAASTSINAEYHGGLNFDDATIYGPDGEILYQPGDDADAGSAADTEDTTQVSVIGDPVSAIETSSVYDVDNVIDLQVYSMLINVGDTVQYPLTSAPAGTLRFETNNLSAAGLKLGTDGKVYIVATAKGDATITITASNGKTGSVMVTVLP